MGVLGRKSKVRQIGALDQRSKTCQIGLPGWKSKARWKKILDRKSRSWSKIDLDRIHLKSLVNFCKNIEGYKNMTKWFKMHTTANKHKQKV